MIILGIDPGIARTGYGIIEFIKGKYRVLEIGVIETSASLPFSKRLKQLYEELCSIIDKFSPDEIAIEELFFSKNTKTAMTVSQARGVIVLACSQKNQSIFEYTPLQVKQGITGYGKADKEQVTKMVMLILKLTQKPKPDDAADALAIAVCHANNALNSVHSNNCL